MSDQFTALGVTKAAVNIFRWGLRRWSDLSRVSTSAMGSRSDSLPSDCSGSSSMIASYFLLLSKISFRILHAWGKSVHAGGTFGLEYWGYR